MTHRTQIVGVEFDPITYREALDRVGLLMQSSGQYYGVTPNPEMLLYARGHPEFRGLLNGAALSVADGIGVLWASTFLKKTRGKGVGRKVFWLPITLMMVLFAPRSIRSVLPQRVTGSDLLLKIVEASQTQGWRIFLLGAAPGVAEEASKKLLKRYPQAKIVGYYSGSPQDQDWPKIQRHLQSAQPEILFVAYGSPAQEQWIVRHLKELPSVKFALGIGGAFDFAAGKIKRAPKPFQTLGLEWLWRLLRQPSRLPRIINATWRFGGMVFKSRS